MNMKTYTLKFIIIFLGFALMEVKSSFNCDFTVNLSQSLQNEGFHRNLTYEIAFVESEQRWLYEGCNIAIDQELPAGVFSNPDELEELRRSLKLNAKPKNRVNVELSTEQSTPVSIYIIIDIKDGQASTWIPVHARYHQASAGGGMAKNSIAKPKLFINCANDHLETCGNKYSKVHENCNTKQDDCKWRVLQYNLIYNPVTWDVPIGNTNHYYLVAFGTALVVVLASLHVFKNLHDFKMRINVKKKR